MTRETTNNESINKSRDAETPSQGHGGKIPVGLGPVQRRLQAQASPALPKVADADMHMLKLVMDYIPQAIFWKDRHSVYLGCNRNFARVAGVDGPDAIVGKTDYDLSWDKEEADFFVACDRRVMETDTPELHIIERQRQADGKRAWLDTNKIPLHDADGNVVGILGTFEDITERKRTQETLQYYESIVAASNEMMSIIDASFVYLAVNDAYLRAHGKQRDEIVGRSVPDLLGATVFEQTARPYLEDALAGKTVTYDAWFDFPEHGKRLMQISYYPNFEADGRVRSVVVNSRDITRVNQLEKKLYQSQKMEAIGTLAGGIAHDFNNILGAIMGFAQLVQLNPATAAEIRGYIDEICTAGERAKDLVDQILVFSRQGTNEKTPCDLANLVNEALSLLRASLPATIRISRSVKSGLGVVKANQTQVHQIVMNLCTNAYHAMQKEGGRLTVELTAVEICKDDAGQFQDMAPGRYVRLTISDTGHGMDSLTLARIYDPYFTTKAIGEGTGLGLATVYGIVKDHGGEIKVYSEPGVGTSFQLLLPVVAMAIDQTPHAPPKLPTGKERILFVDDEKPLVEAGKELLENLGYTVETRTSPHDALKAFSAQHRRYDLVITDMTMPMMTGDLLAKEIKQIRPDLPIILCTGFSHKNISLDTQGVQIDGILRKPTILKELAETVRQVLDQTQ